MRTATQVGASYASLRSVYTTSAIFCTIAVVYRLANVTPSAPISVGVSLGPLLAGASWLQRDAKLLRAPLVYDWGLFLFAMWPAFIAWYAFTTRGWRGVGLIVKLVTALVLPNVVLTIGR